MQLTKTQRVGSAVGLATLIAIPAEGLYQKAYSDLGNPKLLTVCYGSTTDVNPNKVYTLAECRERLDRDMLAAVQQVEACAPGLPVPVLAAFADAVYNMGGKIACDTSQSTAARLLQQRKLKEACEQLPRWNKVKIAGQLVEFRGLTRRRNAEMELCLKGVNDGQVR